MPNFQENLATLENTDAFASMKLFGESGAAEADIDNVAGSQGSFRVYYHVSKKWGGIGPKAAQEALELFAEHTADAKANPGKHPNIDRLFEVITQDIYYAVRCYPVE